MPNNYQFLDANSSIQTAASSVVSGAHQPIVQIGSVLSAIPTQASGNQSISGTINIGNIPSVVTIPTANQSVSGTVNISGNPSISGTVNIGTIPGSVVTFPQGTIISSIVNTVPSSVLVGASIFGQLPAGTAMLGSVAAIVTFPTNQNVSGSVVAFQGGTNISSIVNTVPSSVLVGSSIFGQLPAGTAMLGSVAATVNNFPTNQSVSGTLTLTESGTWINSVISANPSSMLVGNYSQRNDAVASFLGGNLTWNPMATDSAGRVLTKPFSSEDGTIISYTGSVVSGSVTLIQASAIGKRSYITDYWVQNTNTVNSVFSLVTFQDGSTSVIGYGSAPANGGSNSQGIHIPMKTAVSQDLAFKVSPSASIIYLTVKGYQAP